ncbi:MAG: long-chain-fatty-acid--CoA ligase [Myxococcota bacterium]
MLGQMMEAPLLISNTIDFAAKFHPDVEVVSRTVEGPIHRTSYGKIARRSRKLARAVQRLGVQSGTRVATIAWNTHRHLELYFGVSGMGSVLHTINPRLSSEQMDYVVHHAEDHVLFFDRSFLPLAARLMQASNPIKHFVLMGSEKDRASGDPGGLKYYDELVDEASSDYEWPQFDERTASSLCYTSGTTGDPKGVLYSHRSTILHSYCVTMADSLALSNRDVTLPVVPMFHVNAWGVPYAAAMVGSKLVFPGPGLDGPRLLDLVEQEGVTSLLGVPTVWMNLLNEARVRDVKLSSVEKVVIGGSAAPPSMIEGFELGHDVRVLHAWGMTETSPLGTVCRALRKHDEMSSEDRRKLQAKQGRPLFGVDLRIVDDQEQVLPHDGVAAGHLQIRGSWVASSYFKTESSHAHREGWFATGDIACIDPDGYVLLTDRSKDVIKSGGEWISSIGLEGAAMECPGVAQAAVIATPDEKWVERPLLVVVKESETQVDSEQILEFLRAKVPKFWVPERVEFVDALPLGATGKVLKRELREIFAS